MIPIKKKKKGIWNYLVSYHLSQLAFFPKPLLFSGESPSSSASDIDNLNNQGTIDKIASAKGIGSPHVAGNHVIAARNRPSFVRVLNFVSPLSSESHFMSCSVLRFRRILKWIDYNQTDRIYLLLRVVAIWTLNGLKGMSFLRHKTTLFLKLKDYISYTFDCSH